jgi:hypothetical protein
MIVSCVWRFDGHRRRRQTYRPDRLSSFPKAEAKVCLRGMDHTQRLSLLHWNTATLLTCSTDNVRSVSTQRLGGPVQNARGKLVNWRKKTNESIWRRKNWQFCETSTQRRRTSLSHIFNQSQASIIKRSSHAMGLNIISTAFGSSDKFKLVDVNDLSWRNAI